MRSAAWLDKTLDITSVRGEKAKGGGDLRFLILKMQSARAGHNATQA
jgi:hypothetical protein